MADDYTYTPFQPPPLSLGLDTSGLQGLTGGAAAPPPADPFGVAGGLDLTPPVLTQIPGVGPALPSVPTYQPGASPVDWTKIATTAIGAGATIAGQVINATTAQNLAQLQATLAAQQSQTQLLIAQGNQAAALAQQQAAQATQVRLATLQAGTDRAAQASAAQVARTQQLLADRQQTQQTIAGVATSVLGGGGYKAPYAAQNAQALGAPAAAAPAPALPTPAASGGGLWKWALGGLAVAAVAGGGYALVKR